MKTAWTLALGLVLLGGGCSKNDSPSGPGDPGTPVVSKIYVNASNGSNGNAGTESAPLRTIRKALGIAQAGQRVELQAGTYDAAAGQAYPDTIPNGVTVEAVSAGLAVLVSTGQVAFVGSGNDTTLYLSFRGFQTILQSTSGIHVVKSLIAVDVGYAFDLSRSAQAEATGCSLTNSGAASLTDIAQLSLNASTISGPPPNNFFFLVQKAATLQIDGTKMSDGNSTALALTDVSVDDAVWVYVVKDEPARVIEQQCPRRVRLCAGHAPIHNNQWRVWAGGVHERCRNPCHGQCMHLHRQWERDRVVRVSATGWRA